MNSHGAALETATLVSTYGLIFLAELGDKTQLTAMALATKYPWRRIFLGIALAFALLNVGAVAVGRALFALVPPFWVALGSGALFLYFGVKTLLDRSHEEEDETVRRGNPVAVAFSMIFLAELGDKTQLATAGLAAQHDAPLEVFLGSTLSLWSVSLLGIFLGAQLTRYVPLKVIHRVAGCLFLVFGALALRQAFFPA